MPTLNLVFSASSQASLRLGRSAFAQKRDSADADPVFQGFPAKKMQTLFPAHLAKHLKKYHKAKSETERERRLVKAGRWLDEFAQEEDGKSKIWIIQNLRLQVLPTLAKMICGHPVFSRYETRTLYLADEPLENLHWRLLSNWKTPAMADCFKAVCSRDMPSNHANYAKALAAAFPDSELTILPADGALSSLPQIESFLGIKLADSRFSWPGSFAGLDFWAAVRGFPFGSLEKGHYDLQNLFAIVRKVEEEEGFEKFFHLRPRDKARVEELYPLDASVAWSPLPPSFLGERRQKMLQARDLPETLPLIDAAQCEKFVLALPEATRIALLRHFRSKDDLSAEETVLAKGLEEYRTRNFPASPFCWPRPKPVVSVLTMTRNHKDFILDCMESVAMQRTDFPVEHIIVDDLSDDGTQDIIDNYASAHANVRPIYLEGRSRGGSRVRTLFESCKSEFAALCDGDDYFRDPDKLSLQLDFLKKNTSCSLCFHPVLVRHEDAAKKTFLYPDRKILPGGFRDFYRLEDLITGNFIQTNSIMYRWRFASGLPQWFRADLAPADWYWHLLHAEKGFIGFINKPMSVYRRHNQSYFATSLQRDSKEHRKKHGMRELSVLDELNRHFQNRFFPVLSELAGGVLADFVKVQMEEDDGSLLDEAAEKYPEFALNFLKRLPGIN